MNPTNETLLELEKCSSHYKDTTIVCNYFQSVYTIFEFAKKGYQLWKVLSKNINHEASLCYVMLMILYHGDEKQTSNIYENIDVNIGLEIYFRLT